MIDEIILFNENFVKNEKYKDFITNKYPNKKLAILSCMDTRLTKLLPAALGLENGDAKIIKNAGGVISHPYGSAVRSILIAIYQLGVTEIMVIGHSDCGVQHLDSQKLIDSMIKHGIESSVIENVKASGIDLEGWLGGFSNGDAAITNTVQCLQSHPLVPKDILIKGFIMDSLTGLLQEVNK
ncbi:beta-class carbonic anhydrase [Tannockella kyphosi]|uniref:beta-class carbonic anhydrase n=1 Tax=Tannockella kyphosi TaxID=2899121 RepID=UPI00201119BD|nr:carbonic anhydrase [Tannockella kyphosi]